MSESTQDSSVLLPLNLFPPSLGMPPPVLLRGTQPSS